MKFSTQDFFSKCDQICRKLRIWSHLLKKSLMENLIFCAVRSAEGYVLCIICKNANDYGVLNNVKLEDSFVKAGNIDWKNTRSADKGFQKHKTLKYHQTVNQRLVEIPKIHKMFPQP